MNRRKIEVMYFEGCPNVEPALREVHAAIEAVGLDGRVDVAMTQIGDEVEAGRRRFLGSPTVLVDGHDVEPEAATRDDYGLQCRVYWYDGHLRGAPVSQWIAAALTGTPRSDAPSAAEPSPSSSDPRGEHGCCGGKDAP